MEQSTGSINAKKSEPSSTEPPTTGTKGSNASAGVECAKNKPVCPKHAHSSKTRPRHSKLAKKAEDSEEDSSESEQDISSTSPSSDDSSDSDSDSSDTASKKKKKGKGKGKHAKAEDKKLKEKQLKKSKKAKIKKAVREDDSSESDDSSEDDTKAHLQRKAKVVKRAMKKTRDEDESDGMQEDPRFQPLNPPLASFDFNPQGLVPAGGGHPRFFDPSGFSRRPIALDLFDDRQLIQDTKQRQKKKKKVDEEEDRGEEEEEEKKKKKNSRLDRKNQKKAKRASKVAYKRVDQLWDQSIHNFKLTETIKSSDQDEWDQYIFTVRRKFDWEQKYQATMVDIKSTPLKQCLQHVMAGVKGVNLVEDTPHLDPNMLFLYLEEMRTYAQKLEGEAVSAPKRKERKSADTKAKHLRVMVKYLDKDYADVKSSLYPMLENNMITFDLLWALFKPNSIGYCGTYGDQEEPRAFKLDFATKESHFMRGAWYSVEGRYFEYDGRSFGMGTLHTEVHSFHGVRKISSLECYPLQYHKDPEGLRTTLIERGKKFVALQGMNYRSHKGMAYTKRKKQILKINIDGRIMVDPAIHRRINPNYPVSTVKPKEEPEADMSEDDEQSCDCGRDSSSDSDGQRNTPLSSKESLHERKKFKVIRTPDGRRAVVEVDSKDDMVPEEQGQLSDPKQATTDFTEEELLLASPVVLGFAFSEKLWLEFTVSGISDVVFNDEAFNSLVLPENQKSIIKALVSSHAFHASRSIDDIISGKGRGLVAVLHGPPGTGKTLTAEGIADLLRCPLYMVSAGDLGTDPTKLEKELQNILDIAHSWGAVLLLDEADVFLEQRSVHDIHRNALVSIFLRLLEYFQGILFLTTNRVETFDQAFVSRIHLSLRFAPLTTKAKKTVWKLFIDRVRHVEGMEVAPITESDYNDLSRREVNGRQIKNLVRAAQALAIHEGTALSMVHIKRVIDVAESFEMDLKGGTGYSDAMRSYT